MAIAREKITRKTTISGWSRKATQVDQITIGLIVGAANKKPMATEVGNPFIKNRRATGTLPHSQTGNKKPKILPINAPKIGFLGRMAINFCSSLKIRMALERNTPMVKKGRASTNKLRKMVKAW